MEVAQDCLKEFLSDLKKCLSAFNEESKNLAHNQSMIENVEIKNIFKRKIEAETLLLLLQKLEQSFEDSLNNEENNLDKNQINHQMINLFEKWHNLSQRQDIFQNYNQKENIGVLFKKMNDFFSIYEKYFKSTSKKEIVEICSILSNICSIYQSKKVKEFVESSINDKTSSMLEMKDQQIDQEKVSPKSREVRIQLWRQEKLKYVYEFVIPNLGDYKSEEVWILFDESNPELVVNIDVKSNSIDVKDLVDMEFTKSTLSLLLPEIEFLLSSAND